MTDETKLVKHCGGCHCGAVKYSFTAPESVVVQRCNCSICAMTGFVHLIVPGANFELLTDPDNLTDYRFNTGVARHLFCKTCGVKSFYVPRSNPDGISINVSCIERGTFVEIAEEPFDGQNWETNAASLAHLA